MPCDLSMREKWLGLLNGEDVGPMVSPLCDSWRLDEPYRWPYEEPDPFPPGHPQHVISQQIAMAGLCGWDAMFLADVVFLPKDPAIRPETKCTPIPGGTRVESCIHTPYGDLVSVEEHGASDSVSPASLVFATRVVKPWLAEQEDYRKVIWLTGRQMDYDEAAAIASGREIHDAIGERGVLGAYVHAPTVNLLNQEEMFYHMLDWPQLFDELHEATFELTYRQLDTIREAGFDYLFYMASGTEWISPDFFRKYNLEATRMIFAHWHELGGFILWHSCGHVKRFVEEDFYNELKPEIFETLSVPPVGNLPSMRWARERLDPDIVTKGNIPLDILLQGTAEEVRTEVQRVKEEARGYRHVVGLSDNLLENTPLRNCLAFVEESRLT